MESEKGEAGLFAARQNRSGERLGELRCNLPLLLLSVLDSVAISESRMSGRFVSRTDIVARVLSEFADRKIDEASLINQAVQENPTVLEIKPAESQQ